MSKLTLDSVEWREFYFSDIFSQIYIAKSTDYNKVEEGNIPFVGRSSINNGLQGEVNIAPEKINKKDSLTISMVGEPRCFFQPYNFTCSQNILVLQNSYLSKENSQFLIPIINDYLTKKGYGYGYPVGKDRILRSKLMIPIDSEGSPNWQFMEDYIKQERKKQMLQIRNYYEPKMLKLAGELADLEEVEWKEFKIRDIFRFEKKPSKGLNHLTEKENGISYLGATNRNNGVLTFVEENEKIVHEGNAIAFIRNGEGSMGYSVYKKENFIATQDISVGYNEHLNSYRGMFITTIADRVRGKYNFGYKRNQERLENEVLTLPVDATGSPNWQYMEDYVKRLELEQLENVLEYIYIYRTISFHRDFQKSKRVEWKEFWLEDICEIQSGIRLTQSDMTEGDRPFIGATEFNNGITAFVSNTNKSLDSNVLGVNYNGSVVKSFYHEYECVFSDDVKRLKVKDNAYQNKYVYLFLKQVILQQECKYAYGYKFNASRMKRQKIMLPVGQTGEPNYSYMIDQMKWLEFKEMYTLLSAIK